VAYDIVVIGTSWGGFAALCELVAGLADGFGLPIVVVQHRQKGSDDSLATLLQDHTPLRVCEVEDKSPIVGGTLFVAPPDYHLLIDDRVFSLSIEAPVRFSRPSIDLTFASAADSFAERAVGVVLTGANADGARGLRRIADRGGLALVQLPATAECPVMPREALRCVPEARALTIREIAATLGGLSATAMQAGTTSRSSAT
jgi:two-component system chemotaxis response regulator CheB